MDGLASAFLRPSSRDGPGFQGDADLLFDDMPMSFGKPPRGILYAEDFDAPASPDAPLVPDTISPQIAPEELDAARAEGHQAGLAEARQEEATIQAELRTAALSAIGDALGCARADASRIAHTMADELAATLLALLHAALPAAAEALAGREVIALVAALLPGLRREPNASIHVHPSLLGAIAADLQTLWPDHGGRLAVTPDAALAPSDVRVSWEDGEARRDTRALWQNLRVALSPYALPSLQSIMEGIAHGG
jgi:flagellar biosynthesis/type III secretory pathway protein FliH